MDTSKILSGREIVTRGVTKTNTTLPESGQKEISSNGSWLESKQIQSALEARKHLLEVERIEKLGSLSVAIWRDDLKLAEIVKKAGGYWQYIGHNVGKHLYLRPEETLFLIEINSLLLKHNEVIVSLQKAYTLCLEEINLAQYKVYASLSRLGFRVFRQRDFIKINNQQQAILGDAKRKEPTEDTVSDVDMCSSGNSDTKESINTKSHASNKNKNETGKSNENSIQSNSLGTNEDLTVTSQDENKIEANFDKGVVTPELNSIESANNETVNEPKTESKNHDTDFIDSGAKNSSNIENTCNVECMEIDSETKAETNNTNESCSLDAECIKVPESCLPNSANVLTEENDRDLNSTIVASVNISKSSLEKNKAVEASEDITAPEDKKTVIMQNNCTVKLDNTNIVDQISNKIMNKMSMSVVIYEGKKRNTVQENERNKITNVESKSRNDKPVQTYSVDESGVIRACEPTVEDPTAMEIDHNDKVMIENKSADSELNSDSMKNHDNLMDNLENFIMNKIQRLSERRAKLNDKRNDKFLSMPDCFAKKTITINAPDAEFLPKDLCLSNANYVLDLEAIKRLDSKHQNNSNANSFPSGVGHNQNMRFTSHTSNVNFIRHLPPIRQPVGLMRPMFPIYAQQYFMNRNAIPVNVIPTNFMPNHNFSRPRMASAMNHNFSSTSNFHQNNPRKRGNPRFKAYHLRVISNLIDRFKMIAPSHNQDLIRLVNTFNEQYDERYHLTNDYKLIDLNEVQEVIILNDDGQPKAKKARLNDDSEKMNKHLEKLRALAAKLKDLDTKNLANSRHRRVLSNAIKAFNKHFHADIYLNANFEIIDSKLITLDSNSDSDSVVAVEESNLKRKKLRNPFNILKYSGRVNLGASSSKEPVLPQISFNKDFTGSVQTSKRIENRRGLSKFHKGWLPKENDFGRPEICSREEVYLFDIIESECSRAFSKYRVTKDFESWVELKIFIMEQVHERIKALKQRGVLINDVQMCLDTRIQPLVGPDCIDISSALEKLQVIPTAMPFSSPSDFEVRVDFDVYYGNSPSFKKASRPQPNFRVVCFDVSEDILSTQHIEAISLQSRDDVPTLIAAVGFGSISYIQVKNTDIPVYMPDNF